MLGNVGRDGRICKADLKGERSQVILGLVSTGGPVST